MLAQLQRALANSPNNAILTASLVLLSSAVMQLSTAWLQYASRSNGCTSIGAGVAKDGFMKGEYTWLENDFPPTLDLAPRAHGLDLGDPVAMVLEDTRHYPASDGPEADAEWESIYPGESGGFIHVGPNRRFFGLSMYHQIHCLDSIRYAMLGRMHPARDVKDQRAVDHAQHCLNYLRQTIMCAADLTLEPEVRPGSQDVEEGLFATHICRDWSKVHEYVKQNDLEYRRWKNVTDGAGGS